jgi:mannose-6-phosphate isomerase-like protein (cupin superfamily)
MHRSTLVIAAVITGVAWQQLARGGQDATARGQRGGRAGGAPTVPAPAPGSAGIYKTSAELTAILEKATQATPAMSTSPVANTDEYRINIVRRGQAAGAIAHAGNTEVHYVIDGSATFVTGGAIVRSTAAGAAAEIQGGVSRRVGKGDVIVIPENSPHWYKDVDGAITYLEVRFVAPAK